MSGTDSKRHVETADESAKRVKVAIPPNEVQLINSAHYSVNSAGGREWWKTTVIYEVYVRSFFDSNDDGVGDIAGIESKLDYFVSLGVGTLWLSPFYTSEMKDFGYDVSNFLDVDPLFGSLEDIKTLKASMHKKGLHLVMDFIPNHTSDKHEWFRKSVKREEPYTDYYIWKSPKGTDEHGKPIEPNNWVSVFGGSMWEFNEERGEFYLHQFTKEQPDLNYRNKFVPQEMKSVLKFWLDLGVDGFRIDAVSHLFEDEHFRDEPAAKPNADSALPVSPDEYSFWDHPYTTNQPEVLEFLHSLRSLLDEYTLKDGHPRVMMTEAYLPVNELVKYYGTPEKPIAHFPFNFDLISCLNKNFTGKDVYQIVNSWMKNIPHGMWPNWLVGNHDVARVSSRFGREVVDLLHMIVHLLPGTSVNYNGDEIGMENTELSWNETVDPAGRIVGPSKFKQYSRDPERTPMQWNGGKNAGFSQADKTWLPVNNNFSSINVESQLEADESHLKIFKRLVQARKMEEFIAGELEIQLLNDGNVFAFSRIVPNSSSANGLLVVVNFGDQVEKVNAACFHGIPSKLTVYVHSLSLEPTVDRETTVKSDSIVLGRKTGVVYTFQ